MLNPSRRFVVETYAEDSFNAVLQRFLLHKNKKGLSPHTINRIFYNLHPIGRESGNPTINQITHTWLQTYLKRCWLRYAPETMRTKIGDIREFFKWCKKKKHTSSNTAKVISPVRQKPGRYRRARSAEEAEIKQTISHLVSQLDTLVCRDLFGNLQTAVPTWGYKQQQLMRDLFILVLVYESGIRLGELVNLGSATINAAIQLGRRAHSITVYGKTKDRDYFFTNHTAELWCIWQEIRPEESREYAIVGWRKVVRPHPY